MFESKECSMFNVQCQCSPAGDLGYNTTIGYCNPFNMDDISTRRVNLTFKTLALDNSQTVEPNLDDVGLGPKSVSQSGVAGRLGRIVQRSCRLCRKKSDSYGPQELQVMIMREYQSLANLKLGFGDEFWDAYAQFA